MDSSQPTSSDAGRGEGKAPVVRWVKDPIHDRIPLSAKVSVFIDTKQFQRLRNIKQLGTSYYVWPGASHNRFEHCIGVGHLARSVAAHLQASQPELGITDRDVECVELAGLCHDLGHGPWSHVWDGMFMHMVDPEGKWKHEDGSSMMFDALVSENGIVVAPEDVKFIKALIQGDPKLCDPHEKPFLFDIVANRRNGLDVDKFDYIVRDSHMIGEPIKIHLSRLLDSARVIQNQVCYDIKDINSIYEICQSRFRLHKMIYNHKTAKAIEYMIIDALLEANPVLHVAERVYDPEKFLHLTDGIKEQIEASEDKRLAPAQAIFDRLATRDLYKRVDSRIVQWHHNEIIRQAITKDAIFETIRRHKPNICVDDEKESVVRQDGESPQKKLKRSDIIVDFSTMHYGMKEKNPLDNVRFYSKLKPKLCARAGAGDYSWLIPDVFAEVLLQVFTKDAEYYGIVQKGFREVMQTVPLPNISGVSVFDMDDDAAMHNEDVDAAEGNVEPARDDGGDTDVEMEGEEDALPELPGTRTTISSDVVRKIGGEGSLLTPSPSSGDLPVTQAQTPLRSSAATNASALSSGTKRKKPDTPSHSRSSSLARAGAVPAGRAGSGKPLSKQGSMRDNEFLTVDPGFKPQSPVAAFKRPKMDG